MKINLSGIVRWIVGVLFILVALGTLIDGAILAFLISLLVAIICIPVISAPVEKKLNLSLSGPARFVLVLVLFMGFGLVAPDTAPAQSTENIQSPAETQEVTPQETTTQDSTPTPVETENSEPAPEVTPEPTPVATPEPTPEPTPTPSEPVLIAEWTGSAIKNTETFHVDAHEWTIEWDTKPGEYGEMNFQIYVYSSDGTLKGVAANVIGANKDHTIMRGAGDYYLTINTAQPYTVEVYA